MMTCDCCQRDFPDRLLSRLLVAPATINLVMGVVVPTGPRQEVRACVLCNLATFMERNQLTEEAIKRSAPPCYWATVEEARMHLLTRGQVVEQMLAERRGA